VGCSRACARVSTSFAVLASSWGRRAAATAALRCQQTAAVSQSVLYLDEFDACCSTNKEVRRIALCSATSKARQLRSEETYVCNSVRARLAHARVSMHGTRDWS
jgi:hypothetical protein